MKAEEIWAAAVHEANIWMSSHAGLFAEFGAVIIPKIREALKAAREEERGDVSGVQALTYQWMRQHDALLAWIQKYPDMLSKLLASDPRPPSPNPKATTGIGGVLDAAVEWRAASISRKVAEASTMPGKPNNYEAARDRLARAEHRLSDAVKALEWGERGRDD